MSVMLKIIFFFTVPSSPRNVTVVQESFNTVRISWQSPKNPNGPITSYTLWISPPIPPLQKSLSGDVNKVVIQSEFMQNQTYDFWVRILFTIYIVYKKKSFIN